MNQWAETFLPKAGSPHRRLRALYLALTDPQTLGLRQQTSPTLTAAEAFQHRQVNCVSFSLLFTALAREMGIPVYFVLAEEPMGGTQRSDLRVVELHLAVAHGRGSRLRVFDFGGRALAPTRRWLPVSDLTAAALFTSNRGLEALLEGRSPEAVEKLHRATTLDPNRPNLWTNLGVALRRTGDAVGAEEAYRRALELDPTSPVAAHNLSALLYRMGRPELAQVVLRDQSGDGRDPLAMLALAERRYLAGDLEQARKLFRRALELSE